MREQQQRRRIEPFRLYRERNLSGYTSGGGDVILYDAAGNPITSGAPADNIVNAGVRGLDVRAFLEAFDGATMDRLRTGEVGALIHGLNAPDSDALGNTLAFANAGAAGWKVNPALFNNTTWDRERNNNHIVALASAARTATTASAALTNYNKRSVLLELVISANPGGAETLTLTLVARLPGSDYNVVSTAAIVAGANARAILQVGPGILTNWTEAGTTYALTNTMAPRNFLAVVTHSAAGSWTYQVNALCV